MKILVDANILTRKQKTGVDFYTRDLVFAAARHMPNDTFILAYYGRGRIFIPDDINNIRIKRIWWLPGRMYGLHRHYLRFLPLEVLMPVRADAMFFSDFGCPITLQKVPKLTVVHDLAYKIYPQYVLAKHGSFLDELVTSALKNASHVITISQSTKRDIEHEYGVGGRSVSIIPPAVDLKMYQRAPVKEVDAAKAKYGVKGDYILFLSTLEPRKNVAGIIKAYSKLPRELQQKYQLVLAGKKGWLDEEIEALCSQMGERVLRVGRVDSADKAALYSGAAVFVWPSLYEGFGMPILEAMACGAPVITSNVSSMPEAAGDAAAIVDPHSVQAIAHALQNILTNTKVAQDLRERGFKQAKQFTWEKSGQQLADLLHRLVKS